jgi:hypothetical protein
MIKIGNSSKAIIFDASTLISLSMNGLTDSLRGLKKVFKGKFLITEDVKREVIDRPIKIKRFKLEAMRTRRLFEDGIIELPDAMKVDRQTVASKAKEIVEMSNQYFSGREGNIEILHLGEASCLALSKILKEQGRESLIACDERTMRMLIEKPENLKDLLKRKLHTQVKIEKNNFDYFKEFRVIRSTELIYIAYRKNLVEIKDGKEVLDALLYALKFKGCSISDDEIREIKKLA